MLLTINNNLFFKLLEGVEGIDSDSNPIYVGVVLAFIIIAFIVFVIIKLYPLFQKGDKPKLSKKKQKLQPTKEICLLCYETNLNASVVDMFTIKTKTLHHNLQSYFSNLHKFDSDTEFDIFSLMAEVIMHRLVMFYEYDIINTPVIKSGLMNVSNEVDFVLSDLNECVELLKTDLGHSIETDLAQIYFSVGSLPRKMDAIVTVQEYVSSEEFRDWVVKIVQEMRTIVVKSSVSNLILKEIGVV